MLRATSGGSYLDDWMRIRCPTLIVGPGRGMLTPEAPSAMVAALPDADARRPFALCEEVAGVVARERGQFLS
jgi:hypothetical protein